MDLRDGLERVVAKLEAERIGHALIGGLALAAHGAARATYGIDLLVDGDRAADVDTSMSDPGYRPLHRSENVANYVSGTDGLRVDVLFARRRYTKAMLARATAREEAGGIPLRVVDASDLIGLKVQASSNDPGRHRLDVADIVRLLRGGSEIDHDRVREDFRVFDREKELDLLLADREPDDG